MARKNSRYSKREQKLQREFETDLNNIVDDLFVLATKKQWTLFHFSKEANVAVQTVDRLYNRETVQPQLRTVWKLAKALGVEIKLVGNSIKALRRSEAA